MNYDEYMAEYLKKLNEMEKLTDKESTVAGVILTDWAKQEPNNNEIEDLSNNENGIRTPGGLKLIPISNVEIKIVFSKDSTERQRNNIINTFLFHGLTYLDYDSVSGRYAVISGKPFENRFGSALNALSELYEDEELMKCVLKIVTKLNFISPKMSEEWHRHVAETGEFCGERFYL